MTSFDLIEIDAKAGYFDEDQPECRERAIRMEAFGHLCSEHGEESL